MTDRNPGPAVSRRGALRIGGAALGGLVLGSASVLGQDGDGGSEGARQYRVTVTNHTRGQPFTPPALAAHRSSVEVFSVGSEANEPTRQVAENGNLGPLAELIANTNAIRGSAVGGGPLVPESDPGDTGLPFYTTLTLSADASARYLTFISMLIGTNDGIVGLDTVRLPEAVNQSYTYHANGYDVGTERNTELFADLVPPAKTLILGGEPEGTGQSNPDISEDRVIRPHQGILGVGNLPPSVYDWREPAATVQVERVDGFRREFDTQLSGAEEVPPVDTEATGSASFELSEDGDELRYEVTASNIDGVVAAHIHCGAIGSNGPVGVTLFDGGPVTPDGSLVQGTLRGPDDGNGCGWEDLDDVVAAIRSGHTYVNVHTEAYPAGEIRGQLP